MFTKLPVRSFPHINPVDLFFHFFYKFHPIFLLIYVSWCPSLPSQRLIPIFWHSSVFLNVFVERYHFFLSTGFWSFLVHNFSLFIFSTTMASFLSSYSDATFHVAIFIRHISPPRTITPRADIGGRVLWRWLQEWFIDIFCMEVNTAVVLCCPYRISCQDSLPWPMEMHCFTAVQ